MKYFLLFFCLLIFGNANAQNLEKNLDAILTVATKNPEQGKVQLQKFSRDAFRQNAIYVYLQSLHYINWCNITLSDYNATLASSMFSLKEAKQYKNDYYAARSSEFIARAYIRLGIESEFKKNYQEAFEYSKNLKGDSLHNIRKLLYSLEGEFYNEKEDHRKFVASTKKSIQEIEKLVHIEDKVISQIQAYSNLALGYKYLKQYDSMYIFSKKTLELDPAKNKSYFAMCQAYNFIGEKKYIDKSYDEAISNLLKSLELANSLQNSNLRLDNYALLSKVYLSKKNNDKYLFYTNLYHQLQDSLLITKSKNGVTILNKIIKEKETNLLKEKKVYKFYIFSAILMVTLSLIFVIRNFRKKKEAEFKYRITTDLLLEEKKNILNLESKINDSFEELLVLGKKNSPNFYVLFSETYQGLTSYLQLHYPELTMLDKKFLALIYLNFSTKELSEILFITTKSVENRKNRIRKKCNLEPRKDLKNWLDEILNKSKIFFFLD